MDREIVDRIPLEIQKQIVYNFLLLREDIQPCVGTLVGYRMLINSYSETINIADCQHVMQHLDAAIKQLEWCYQTYFKSIKQLRD
ncbi:hypothetical protein [Herpetosiphon gulosus]|uniref:Uncharacterized protein n=1 Tax=Herpetosiphon gulosus TaxID=1973496 RepID=A0ABP9WW74_9CHLR